MVGTLHPHVWWAVMLGALIISLPLALAQLSPASLVTRQTVAVAQMLCGSLLIHLTGGRIETHFILFGSLAFLAFYRDPSVLVIASLIVAADHGIRGELWPESVYGVPFAEPWRWLEHTGWLAFENVFLIWSCRQSTREMRLKSERQARLEVLHEQIERQVEARTAELTSSEARKASIIELALDAVIMADADGRIVEFNPSAERMFGRPRAEVLGRPLARLDNLPELGTLLGGHGGWDASRWQEFGRPVESKAVRGDGSRFVVELALRVIEPVGRGA